MTQWPHLALLLDVASGLAPLEVWLFGSALRSEDPADLDVLLVYQNRRSVVALRDTYPWEDCLPPFHLIAMTPREVVEYDFIATTNALRLL